MYVRLCVMLVRCPGAAGVRGAQPHRGGRVRCEAYRCGVEHREAVHVGLQRGGLHMSSPVPWLSVVLSSVHFCDRAVVCRVRSFSANAVAARATGHWGPREPAAADAAGVRPRAARVLSRVWNPTHDGPDGHERAVRVGA